MSLANLKKGDSVILYMFTGLAVAVKEVIAADKSTVTLETHIGTAKFSKKTGRQIEPKAKADRFANYITEDDGSFIPNSEKRAKKAGKKPAKAKKAEEPASKKRKKKKPDPEPEDFDEDEYQEEDDE